MSEIIETIIKRAYAAFNARNTDAVLVYMQPNVHWPNGWEGGYVEGHEAVRDYWTRQWNEIDPEVEPVSFTYLPDGRTLVNVHQKVKNKQGAVLFDGTVLHLYTFENGLINSMEISQ